MPATPRKVPTLVLATVAVLGLAAHIAHAQSYTFITLDDPAASPGATSAQGINNAGQIVGVYYNSSGEHGFIATPNAAPEPSQSAALALGALSLSALTLRTTPPGLTLS